MNLDIRVSRRVMLALAALALSACAQLAPVADPLPSWQDGAAKSTIVQFVKKTTDAGSAQFVPPAERVATLTRTAHCGSNNPCTHR